MNGRLSLLEEIVLFAAEEGGRIPFPEGSADGVSKVLNVILEMESKGYLFREAGGFRPYALTEKGKIAREGLGRKEATKARIAPSIMASRRSTTTADPAEGKTSFLKPAKKARVDTDEYISNARKKIRKETRQIDEMKKKLRD